MTGTDRPHVLIIGVGNRHRGDDGAGTAIIAALEGTLPAGVQIALEGGEATRLMDRWQGMDAVIVIDAMQGEQAGTVARFNISRGELPPAATPDPSSHAFGVAEAVRLSAALACLPARLVIYSVAGADFGHGEGLSPAVAAAVPEVAEQIRQEITAIQETHHA